MTPTMKRCLDALEQLEREGLYSATARTIAREADCTPQHARRCLYALVDAGYVRMTTVEHRPTCSVKSLRYKSFFMLPANYVYEMEVDV